MIPPQGLPPIRITKRITLVSRKDPSGPDIAHCDVFAVDCGSTFLLIDAGPGGDTFSSMRSNMESLEQWKKLSACLITHIHEDHAAGIAQLRREKIPIIAGRTAEAYTRSADILTHYREEPPFIDRTVSDGEIIQFGDTEFQALDTPGHTAGCVTWLAKIDGLRCAFTGDLLFPNGTIGWSGGFDFDGQKLKASLERLLTLEPDAIFTGHHWNPQGPESFWLTDAKKHILQTLRAGAEGRWNLNG